MATDSQQLPQYLLKGLLEQVQALARLRLRYALIGGVVTGYRSRPRFTQDVGFLLEIPQVTLPGLLEDMHARGFAFDVEKAIREWTKDHLTVLTFHGIRIDWLKPLIPIYQHVIDGAKKETWMGSPVQIASAEGLILTKLIAFRTQDQLDIENLLAANRGRLDLEWIRKEWATVADSSDRRLQRFEDMVVQFYVPLGTDDSGPAM
jgi:hypothetical protein